MQLKYIDVHSHLQFSAFDANREEILERMRAASVGTIVVGTQKTTSKSSIELAHRTYPHTEGSPLYVDKMWATVGLHPIHTSKSFHDEAELGGGEAAKAFTSRGEIFDYDTYLEMARDPRVVAIGECGLDYYEQVDAEDRETRLGADWRERQIDAFLGQIKVANEVRKPLMLHIRQVKGYGGGKAYDDVLELLKKYSKTQAHVHSFCGDPETAKKFIDFGCTLSFTGVITFRPEYAEAVKAVPLDRIMADTDSPYLSPVPYRGKQNEPAYVVEIIKKIAEIKELDFETARTAILENSFRAFKLEHR
ncbi:MAG: TatD family hydrolase [Candidatus Vogelbacteria bacterium]|nr:TatD family hydrolase [Candidatus Vogelbacteria bacterium]